MVVIRRVFRVRLPVAVSIVGDVFLDGEKVFNTSAAVGLMRFFNPYVGWVEFADPPQRIVSLCPSATEILFMLGVGEKVVGVSSWCHRPREALSKPKVGSYVDVVEEKLKELRPDLVITTIGAQRTILEKILGFNIPTYPIPFPKDVYGIFSSVLEVGGLVGKHDEALELVRRLLVQVDELRKLAKSWTRPSVYIEIDLGGPTIPAYFNHVTSALDLAGLRNVFSDQPTSYLYGMKVGDYPVLDVAEEIRRRNPDVIVYESKSFHPSDDEGMRVMLDRGLEDVSAVRNGRVLTVPADTLAHYGPSYFIESTQVFCKIWNFF